MGAKGLTTEEQVIARVCTALLTGEQTPSVFSGLCGAVKSQCGPLNTSGVLPVLGALYQRWPGYSGDEDYPVPYLPYKDSGGVLRELPEDATPYDAWCGCYAMWDKSTPYGAARWAMVKWIHDYLAAKREQ